MARNSLAGKSSGKSKSAKHYAKNKSSRKKKNEYDKKYSSTTKRKKYRSSLNKANKKAKTYGNKDGLDMSHTKKGKLVKEKQSKNRARNRGKK
tara:strand:+ start:2137 stop:2415 length:279 start_codon:yes stop_codon:yes gene_type:complete